MFSIISFILLITSIIKNDVLFTYAVVNGEKGVSEYDYNHDDNDYRNHERLLNAIGNEKDTFTYIPLSGYIAITFHKNRIARSILNKSSDNQQIKCIGGKALADNDIIDTIRCSNKHYITKEYEYTKAKITYLFECVIDKTNREINVGLSLENIEISCEGNNFDYHTVLIGSCSIYYSLEYIPKENSKEKVYIGIYKPETKQYIIHKPGSIYDFFSVFAFIVTIFLITGIMNR